VRDVKRLRINGLLVAALFVAGIIGCDSNPPPPPVPVGTDCSAFVIACYDEFAHQPANLICFRPTSRWNKTALTWQLTNRLPGIDEDEQLDAARRAFDLWASVSTLTFQETDSDDADIVLTFLPGNGVGHGDDFPFPMPGNSVSNVIGHAFFPGSPEPGDVHFNENESWSLAPAPGEFDLFTVMLHEIGHALGLEHTLVESAVMAPSYQADGFATLTETDISAIRALYGSKDGVVPPLPVRLPQDFCEPENLTSKDDPDSDGDGIPDTIEVFVLGTDPLLTDTDDDGVDDFQEVFIDGTSPTLDPNRPDNDQDLLPDDLENDIGSDVALADTDGDGLMDGLEFFFLGTNPRLPDTDGDGANDTEDPYPTNPCYSAVKSGCEDCNGNGLDDAIDLLTATSRDCNENFIPDDCDINDGTSVDANENEVPDDCEVDQCDDGNACTTDRIVNDQCVNTPINCDDGLFCNGVAFCLDGDCRPGSSPCSPSQVCNEAANRCDPNDGGGSPACRTNADCDDDQFCNGVETCSGGACFEGAAPCKEGETCDEAANECLPECVPSQCNDGLFCNGVETCSGGACVDGEDPCTAEQSCNENTDKCLAPSDCNDNGVEDGIDIAQGNSPDCNDNGKPDECDVADGTSVDANQDGRPDECPFFVNAAAPAEGDGRSWETAFNDLGFAMSVVVELGIPTPIEIWVAQGTYRPAPLGSGDRAASFHLFNNLALYGGFAGNEKSLNQRRPNDLFTVLNGDLTGTQVTGGMAERGLQSSYHVVRANGVGPSAVLDGFFIAFGNADAESFPDSSGGGLLIEAASPTIANCTLIGNSSFSAGGAVFIFEGMPTFLNTVLVQNTAGTSGGGVAVLVGVPTFTNCTFSLNNAGPGGAGGGIALVPPPGAPGQVANAFLQNTILWANSDRTGMTEQGQIFAPQSAPVVQHCCIQGLTARFGQPGNIGLDPLFENPQQDPINGLRLLPGSPCIDAGNNAPLPKDTRDLDGDGITDEPTPVDRAGGVRQFDVAAALDCPHPGATCGSAPIVDIGTFESIGDDN